MTDEELAEAKTALMRFWEEEAVKRFVKEILVYSKANGNHGCDMPLILCMGAVFRKRKYRGFMKLLEGNGETNQGE